MGNLAINKNIYLVFSHLKRSNGLHLAINGRLSACHAYDGATASWRCGANDHWLFDRFCYRTAHLGTY